MTDNRARWAAPEILQREYQCLASDVYANFLILNNSIIKFLDGHMEYYCMN